MFALAGVFFFLAGLALWQAFGARRLRQWRSCGIALLISLPLALTGGVLFWLGSEYPNFNIRRNAGFPPNWSCLSIGEGDKICGPDRPEEPQRPGQTKP